jgi:hypothetical protein
MPQRRLRPSQGGKFMPPVGEGGYETDGDQRGGGMLFSSYAGASTGKPLAMQLLPATMPSFEPWVRYWDESGQRAAPLRLSEERFSYRVEFPTEPTETTPGEIVANAIFEMRCPHCIATTLTPGNARFAMGARGRLVICAACSRIECRALGRCEGCGVKDGQPHASQCTEVQHRKPWNTPATHLRRGRY